MQLRKLRNRTPALTELGERNVFLYPGRPIPHFFACNIKKLGERPGDKAMHCFKLYN